MGKEVFRLEHVSRIFRTKEAEVRAVDDVSLVIEEGDIYGIIGMSGAGKSTLVRTLNRLEPADEGTVLFYGEDLSKLGSRDLNRVRQSMPMIFQGFNLLMQKTVLDNVVLPLKIAGRGDRQERREKALEMLRIVGLEDKAKAYPAQLSGGQRQRVAIARALTVEPKVLLCDEATSALDPKITEEILELLKNINREMGLTVIIITHEMSVVEKICTKVAIIDHGRLAETGSVREIFTNPKSDAARHLILPGEQEQSAVFSRSSDRHKVIRIVFDGRASSEPLIANLARETGQALNILYANTKSVGGVGFGQMIVELPESPEAQKTALNYLREHGVTIGEVD